MNSILFAPIISLSTFMIPNLVDMNQAYIIDYEKKSWNTYLYEYAYLYELYRVKKKIGISIVNEFIYFKYLKFFYESMIKNLRFYLKFQKNF